MTSPPGRTSAHGPELWTTTSVCGGISGLSQCGEHLPSEFCCPPSTTCLALAAVPNVIAAICCPAGGDCSKISPISCDQNSQNATTTPESQYHSDPTLPLGLCGSGCCPQGYQCANEQCVQQASNTVTSSTTTTSASASASTSDPVTTNRPTPRLFTRTSTLGSIAHSTSTDASSHSNISTSGGMSPTTIALLALLIGLIFMIFLAACVWYLYKRHVRMKEHSAELRVRSLIHASEKPELDGISKEVRMSPREMDGSRSPKELSGSSKRPRTLNSIRRELDVEHEK